MSTVTAIRTAFLKAQDDLSQAKLQLFSVRYFRKEHELCVYEEENEQRRRSGLQLLDPAYWIRLQRDRITLRQAIAKAEFNSRVRSADRAHFDDANNPDAPIRGNPFADELLKAQKDAAEMGQRFSVTIPQTCEHRHDSETRARCYISMTDDVLTAMIPDLGASLAFLLFTSYCAVLT